MRSSWPGTYVLGDEEQGGGSMLPFAVDFKRNGHGWRQRSVVDRRSDSEDLTCAQRYIQQPFDRIVLRFGYPHVAGGMFCHVPSGESYHRVSALGSVVTFPSDGLSSGHNCCTHTSQLSYQIGESLVRIVVSITTCRLGNFSSLTPSLFTYFTRSALYTLMNRPGDSVRWGRWFAPTTS